MTVKTTEGVRRKIFTRPLDFIILILCSFLLGISIATLLEIRFSYIDHFVERETVQQSQILKPTNERVEMIMDYFNYLNPGIDPRVAEVYAEAIDVNTKIYALPPSLIVAIMNKETLNFNPLSVSKVGCVGLMQINPKAHPKKIDGYKKYELFHVDVNIRIGCWILKDYIKSEGSIKAALKKYSGGATDYENDILTTFAELELHRFDKTGQTTINGIHKEEKKDETLKQGEE